MINKICFNKHYNNYDDCRTHRELSIKLSYVLKLAENKILREIQKNVFSTLLIVTFINRYEFYINRIGNFTLNTMVVLIFGSNIK